MNNDNIYQDIDGGEKIAMPQSGGTACLMDVFLVRVMSFGWALSGGEVQPAVFCAI